MKARRHRGWVYSQTRSPGPNVNGQLPCILDRQRRLPKTLRDHVRSASVLSALKKSLVANLSAKRQLSVAKLSAKRIFSLAKRDFLVANGRMAADFSSPGVCVSVCVCVRACVCVCVGGASTHARKLTKVLLSINWYVM